MQPAAEDVRENSDVVTSPAIAVIGMAGRFPGARDVGRFWANLRDGIESIHTFSDEELLGAGELPDRLRDPSYVKSSGRLEDIDKFAATFFGWSPRDAAVCDPQHRLFLECAWQAFEDAGYVAERVAGPVGVFASSGASEYMMYNLVANREIMDSVGAWLVRHTGNDTNFFATRVSYELNVRGPSMSVQTACSSSLLAVHLACQSLLAGECDMALAGGATVYPEQNRGYVYKQGEVLSPDGHCRAFDARAAGTVMASALGCVVLKRLDDALRDGDRVLAVVRGSAVNNDGSDKVGYLAPSVAGQTRVVSEALAIAGVSAEDVSYVEAHGTGTLIGDPIEVTALTEAFRESTDRTQFCALGSLKTNVGHAGEAAGVCGLIKTVLALKHRQIPPSLHYADPNPQLDLAASPFFVNDRLRDWMVPDGRARIAGVTALGAGGTNVHVVVQEAPPAAVAAPGRTRQVLVVSAQTESALAEASKNLATHLRARPREELADVAFTLLAGRKAFPFRRAIVAKDALEAADALDGLGDDRFSPPGSRLAVTDQHVGEAPSVVFMFPGGGAQYARMGADLYATERVYRDAIELCLSALPIALADAIRIEPRLEAPAQALPALFATTYAVAMLLESWGIVPTMMIGHSAGEYVAACLAGVLAPRDAMALVALRGRLFETLPAGAMLSVALPEAEARAALTEGLSLAAVNGPSLCVASGPAFAIDRMEAALRARDVDCARLRLHAAAHSSMVEPILAEFEAFCRTIPFRSPGRPFVSNLTGTWITDEQAVDPAYWVRHLRETVRFGDGIRTVLGSPKHVLVEVGPGRTLSTLARQQSPKSVAVTTVRHAQEEGPDDAFMMGAVARLWTAGVAVDEAKFFAGEARRRVRLPTYPFERQRYWIDADAGKLRHRHVGRQGELRKVPDVGDWFHAPSWGRSALAARPEPEAAGTTWLVFTDETSLATRLVERLKDPGRRIVIVSSGKGFAGGKGIAGATGFVGAKGTAAATRFVIDPSNRADYDALAAELRRLELIPYRVIHLWALAPRARALRLALPGRLRPLADYRRRIALDYYSLVFFSQAFAADFEAHHARSPVPLRVTVVSSHMQGVPGDVDFDPEKAVLLGACKVIPREYPQVHCASVDVAYPRSRDEEQRVASQLLDELQAGVADGDVALRGRDRWVRRFDRIRLSPDAGRRAWLRQGGIYLVTGGLGGIGLTVAEHLAKHAKARLVLVGRTPMPVDEDAWCALHGPDDETSRKIASLRAMRAEGAEVMTAAADVTDLDAMRAVLSRVHARFGAVDGVFHVAGQLDDAIIARRAPRPESSVIDTKMRGALVLDAVLRSDAPELFVLFSSVSSLLGLAGQADYSAANAFLDAFAFARAARDPARRTLSIDWNAWQEIGMLAAQAPRGSEGAALGPGRVAVETDPLRMEVLEDDATSTLFRGSLRRSTTWLLSEHVVHGGTALIPGTGLLEVARAALEHRCEERAVELREVFFLAPFAVGPDEARTLHLRIDRHGDGAFTLFGESERDTFVTGKARYVDAAPAPRLDRHAVRARCTRQGPVENGFLVQPFMDFGRRWGCVEAIHLGSEEALIALGLPDAFAADLDAFRLHPALLDMAVGGAQALVAGFDPMADFYVPFSYGRVLLRRPLPARFTSHVRLRAASATPHVKGAAKGAAQDASKGSARGPSKESVVFDATLYGEDLEEIASIEGFVMRRVPPEALATPAPGRAGTAAAGPHVVRGQSDTARTHETFLREGMTPAEGMDALDRMLAANVSPQMVACTVDLEAWLEQLAEETARARAGRETDTPAAGVPVFARDGHSATFVAPRDAIERELACMWRELLGVAEPGVHDDFFELGGQSLIAVRLFHRIGKTYRVELPLAALFEASTIAQCASLLRARLGPSEECGASGDASGEGSVSEHGDRGAPGPQVTGEPRRDERSFRSLVTIRPGQGKTPFFCVHGAGGNVLNLRDLAHSMDAAQPFYGIQAHGVDGVTTPHATIESMAMAYLAEVCALQPEGPYLLGGYSGGGLVAFEMAQRLTAAGKEVKLLALIDTLHPQMPLRNVTMATRFTRLREEKLDYVAEAVTRRREWVRDAAGAREIERQRTRGEPVALALRDLHLTRSFGLAASLYRPKPWTGRATLFRAAEVAYIYCDAGPAYGWEQHVLGGVEVVTVPGDHATIVLGANAPRLVRSLGAAIARAQSPGSRNTEGADDETVAVAG